MPPRLNVMPFLMICCFFVTAFNGVSADGGWSAARCSTPSHSSDVDSDSASNSLQNMSSVSSLIGNHPTDDILYLHCKRCQCSYGSVHAFRKHFRNVHGAMPSSEDVLIQGIKATKEFVANQHETPAASNQQRFHCTYCGWQGDHSNQTAFTRHLNEHYNEKGSIYRCMYCRELTPDANSLKLHLSKHPGVLLNVCSLCFVAFETHAQLSLHFTTNHRMAGKQPKVAAVPPHMPGSSFYPMVPAQPNSYHNSNGLLYHPGGPAGIRHSKQPTTPPTLQDFSKMPHTSSGWSYARSARPKPSTEMNRKLSSETATTHTVKTSSSSSIFTSTCSVNNPTNASHNNISTVSLDSVLNAAINMAVSSSVAEAVKSPATTSSDSHRTQINLMSLLDKVVEQGLRNAG